MINRINVALIFVVIVALVAVVAFLLRGEPLGAISSASPASKAKALGATTSHTALPTSGKDRSLDRLVVREIQSSSDVRATYDKYKSVSDPNGEIAFLLSAAIDNCSSFADKSAEQISSEMNAIGPAARESLKRRTVIERQMERCKGLLGWGSVMLNDLHDALSRKAVAAGHPGAIAATLSARLSRDGAQALDAEAIHLLSGTPDGAVIKGVYDYLARRNGDSWLAQSGDPSIVTAAWALLQCNYGVICDNTSRIVVMGCIYYAACDQHDVASMLPVIYPSLTPDKFGQAVRTQSHLASLIQSRDWAQLGFSKQ